MRPQAVLFDLDGTLLNRRETFRCHIEQQVAGRAELFASGVAVDIDRTIAIDDNGNCPRDDFYRKLEVEFGLGHPLSFWLACSRPRAGAIMGRCG